MTYTEQQINFSSEAVEQARESEATTLQKVKALQQESTQRAKRIAEILRTAFSETSAELQAGRTVMSPWAKEVTADTVAAVKENGQKVSETVNQIWQEAEDEDITERIIRFIRSLAATAKEKLSPQIKDHVRKLARQSDSALSGRYGDRYTNLKEQFDTAINTVRTWYGASEKDAFAHTVETDAADAPSIEVESQVIQ